jgi:hypothetical protein
MGIQEKGVIKKACYKDHCFEVEVAKSKKEKRTGLMGKETLAENKGMIFLYSKPGIHSFWMKNTLVPLDIIWLDKNQHVIYIKHNAQPCENGDCPSFGPDRPAKYVLEIQGGEAEKIGLEKGDKLHFK